MSNPRDILGPQRFSQSHAAPKLIPPNASVTKRYFIRVVTGVTSLLTGMRVTIGKFFDPRTTVTQQYPENRDELKMAERFRGRVVMPHDADGEHNCTGCTLCEKACPNGSISVLNTKHASGRKILGKYIYRLDSCTLCNLCIEACPFGAIEMGTEFELATTRKEGLVEILNKKAGRL
ncbi:MAG: 4Fe-4S binding protein [Planctomycetota bacterium]|jgi:NADH-quinone oxidoreductase subunit I|nr:4Fe-4S binding protein [Planctomycetota bacterium]